MTPSDGPLASEGEPLRESMMLCNLTDPFEIVMSISDPTSAPQQFDTELKAVVFEIIADRLNISSESMGSGRTPRTI
jgi:hypothetical protein